MSISSVVDTREEVENKLRRFGASGKYIPTWVIDSEGNKIPALLTHDQIRIAVERAKANPEDLPEKTGFLSGLFGLFK